MGGVSNCYILITDVVGADPHSAVERIDFGRLDPDPASGGQN